MPKNEGVARVWEVDPGRPPVADNTLEAWNPAPARRSATSPGGDLKAVAPRNTNVVELRATSTGRLLASPAHAGVRHVTFSPDGRALATSGGDSVRVWTPARGGCWPSSASTRSPCSAQASLRTPRAGSCWRSAPTAARGSGFGAWAAARWPRASPGCDAPRWRSSPTGGLDPHGSPPSGRELIFTDRAGRVSTYACEVCGPAEALVDLANRRATRELTPAEKDDFGVED